MKRVGISANLKEDIHSSFEKYDICHVADNYIRSVCNVNAIPVVLPVVENDKIIRAQLQGLDALILSGGEDIYPQLYNEEMLQGCGESLIHRDVYDIKLIKLAIEMQIPVLGICRGAQVINVALGGSLYQDLSYMDNISIKHSNLVHQKLKSHKAIISKDGALSSIYKDEVWVNSFHHQAVKDLAKGLTICAQSTDGVIEAFEGNFNNTLILGVQWHPEMMASSNDEEMIKLFNFFINNKH